MSVSSTDLRNIAIIGHIGTGKTSLLEQILFQCGVISRAENVATGKSVSDFTEEEISREMSIHTAMAPVEYEGKLLTFLDTPGTADFIGEVIGALRTCENALMVVDARDGAQIETIKLWKRLDSRNKPRAVFMNRCDRDRADFFASFTTLKEQIDATYVPVTIPMGSGSDFKGVINLIEMKAYTYDANGKETVSDIPAEYKDIVEEYEFLLIEAAAEGTDELIEKYFEEGTLNPDEIREGLRQGLSENRIVPVLAGAGEKGSGIASLLHFIKNNFVNPLGADDEILRGDDVETIHINEDGPCAAYVFKTTIDQFSGKLSFVKIVQGHLNGDTEIMDPTIGKKEKPGKVYHLIGKKLVEVPSLSAGEIGIIAKSNIAHTNSTLTTGDLGFTFFPLRFPSPVYSLAITAGDKKSEDKMNDALHRVVEEDITFQTSFNEETKESTVSGMGELHITMILDRIKDKQKISINTKTPRVAYRETITKKSGVVEYAHKKQSGGHGQYGKVLIEIEPLQRGEMYSFTNAIKGGSVSKGYMPGIEKGLHDAMEEGFLAHYPLVDIGITIVDGKEHPVDSSEMAFRLAAKGAMKAAIDKAGPVLLEPFMNLSVYISDQYLGDILSDLSGKRGRVLGQEDIGGGITLVKAEVPQAEMLNYSIDLKSMTSGTGSFEIDFDHYEAISGRIADDVIARAKADHETE